MLKNLEKENVIKIYTGIHIPRSLKNPCGLTLYLSRLEERKYCDDDDDDHSSSKQYSYCHRR